NPSASPQGANRVSSNPNQRIQNWSLLVQQIRTYYQVISGPAVHHAGAGSGCIPADQLALLKSRALNIGRVHICVIGTDLQAGLSVSEHPSTVKDEQRKTGQHQEEKKDLKKDNLKQLIVIPPPNVLLLGRSPYCEQSLAELRKVLLLLLGCAVQCEKKEEYIERIQTLDFDTKAAIAVHIQELTHSQENILDLQWLDSSEMSPDELEAVARNVVAHLRHLLDQRNTHLEVPSFYLEEKSEQMLDCRHELENMEMELKRIQQENSQLLVEARAARTYRDELDALRERAIKADKLESEVGRYREQLHKIEFYKAKVEELKEDNRVLQETKEVLEDQLAGWRARSDKIHQLEKHSLLLKARVHDIEQEREADQRRIEELVGENLALCLAQRRSMEESQLLGWELEQLSKTAENSPAPCGGIPEALRETAERVKGLEADNRELSKQAAIDQRTLATLREELVNEKMKMQQRDNDLNRLVHELEMKVLNQESVRTEQEAQDSRCVLASEDKMADLEAHLQESSRLNQQLRQELSAVKLSYEALHQRQEELTVSCSTPPGDTGRVMTEWLRESQEATKELLKLKDHLIEVERNVSETSFVRF
ncbi:unnamed protein product, partial [Tetraodon nigroviridis]